MSVVVADFGLAKVLPDPFMRHSEKPSPTKTHTKRRFQRKKRYTIVGSAYWMAPEMLNGQKYDEKVDQFSYGIVICEVYKTKLCFAFKIYHLLLIPFFNLFCRSFSSVIRSLMVTKSSYGKQFEHT